MSPGSCMSTYFGKLFRKERLQKFAEKYLSKSPFDFEPSQLELLKGYQDENGEDLRKSLVKVYFETSPGLIAELERSFGKNDEAFRHAAHTLKSSTAAVGGKKLASLFEALETAGISTTDGPGRLEQIQKNYDELRKNLEQYLKGIKPSGDPK